jgi:hypothetical protein
VSSDVISQRLGGEDIKWGDEMSGVGSLLSGIGYFPVLPGTG